MQRNALLARMRKHKGPMYVRSWIDGQAVWFKVSKVEAIKTVSDTFSFAHGETGMTLLADGSLTDADDEDADDEDEQETRLERAQAEAAFPSLTCGEE